MAVFTGLAAAIGGAISAVSSFIGGLGAIGSFLLKTAVGIGVNLIAKSLAGKPEKPQFSVNGQLQAGGDVPRSFIFGRYVTAGSLVYANTWGNSGKTPNSYFTQVIALSDIPINGIRQLLVNGEPVTIEGDLDPDGKGNKIAEYRTGGDDNHMWIRFYDGTQTAVDSFLVNTVSSAAHPWEATRVGHGIAYAIVTSQVDGELFTGFPAFKFELQGTKLYDPSRESSVGGSGVQRYDTPSTWGGDGDDLPAVQSYNLLRGISYNSAWLYGLQNFPAARLPVADWIAQINKCRALIAGPAGNEPQYLSGGEIHVGAQIADAVEAILTTCQGRLSEIGGVYKIHVGEPDAPVFAFSDDDILSTEEQSFTPFFGLADTINGVSATYPEPLESWNTKTAPALFNATYEAQDGNRRLMADVQLDMVYRSSQVQRLMKSALAEGRRARRHTLVLGPSAWILEPGDVILWNSVRNGYEDKLFRIDGVADRGNLDVTIDITEVDPSDYDWDQGADYTPPVFGPIGPVRPSPQPIVDWFAEPDAVEDNDGNPRRPAILLSWDGDQPDVRAVEFEVRNGITLQVQYRNSTDNPSVGSIQISQGLLPNTLYGVRGRYIAASERQTLWSTWLLVTTPNILLGEDDIYLPGMVEEVQQSLRDKLAFIQEGLRYHIKAAQQLDEFVAEQSAQSFEDRKEIVATVGTFKAEYTETIRVVASATAAAVLKVETLEATVNDPVTGLEATANITNTLSVMVNDPGTGLVATANAVQAATVTIGKFSASGLLRSEQVATEVGAQSTIAIGVAANAGALMSQAAMFLSAIAGGLSEIGFVADRIFMVNGSDKARPFVFQSGILYLDNVKVNTLAALSAVLGTVDISNAIIGNLIVGTSNLGFRSVTANVSYSYPNTSGSTGGAWVVMATAVTQNPEQTPVFCEYGLFASGTSSGPTPAIADVRWRHAESGAILKQIHLQTPPNAGSSISDAGFFLHDTPSLGTNTYVLERNTGSGGSNTTSAYVKSVWWKK